MSELMQRVPGMESHEGEGNKMDQEVRDSLADLRTFKDTGSLNSSSYSQVDLLLTFLPDTKVDPEEFGLTQEELPELVRKYTEAQAKSVM